MMRTRPGLRPNAGGEVAAYQVAKHRKSFRVNIAPVMSDADLTTEMAFLYSWITAIRAGSRTVLREAELVARLRALRHEAMIVRGWDAMDPRIKWEGKRS